MRQILISFLIIYAYTFFTNDVKAQILNDVTAQKQSTQALDNIYNFRFKEAEILIEKVRLKYPQHPAVTFMKAMVLYWRYVPLTLSSKQFSSFDNYLNQTITRADVLLKKNKNDIEGVYFKMLGYSLKAMIESEEGSFAKSVNYGKKAFTYMKKGFSKTGVYPDFHFSTGLYKYYAEQYPETHPIAKPFMTFFPNGSRKQGLNHLIQASNSAQFSKTESQFWLTQVYAKYEKNYNLATYYAQKLTVKYPRNPIFWVKYVECLMWQGKYTNAEKLLYKFDKNTKKSFVIASATLKGWLQEKYYKSNNKAELAYKKAVQYTKYEQRYAVDYVSCAYAGLARIAHKKGNIKLAKTYYKKCLSIAQYEAIREEGKKYLRNH